MKKPVYSGVFLDTNAMRILLAWFERETGVALLPDVPKDPHLTIAFKPSLREVEEMPLGYTVKLTVTGWAADEKSQVLTVKGFPSDRTHPHITLATAPGVSPAYSKELLDREAINQVHGGPTVEGLVGYYDGKVQYRVPQD
jgi:hypothetical protein